MEILAQIPVAYLNLSWIPQATGFFAILKSPMGSIAADSPKVYTDSAHLWESVTEFGTC